MTKPINHLDITQIEKVKNYFNTKMDFNHLGTKEDSDSSDETPFELEKMISELEDQLTRIKICVFLSTPKCR